MKTLITCLCLTAAAFLFAADNTPPSPEGIAVNRYQLASGVVPTFSDRQAPQPTMFRIDSATGRVWNLVAVPMLVQGQAQPVMTWIELHETNGILYQKALESLKAP